LVPTGFAYVAGAKAPAALREGLVAHPLASDDLCQEPFILFPDGNPTAFRGMFTRNGNDYAAVGYAAELIKVFSLGLRVDLAMNITQRTLEN